LAFVRFSGGADAGSKAHAALAKASPPIAAASIDFDFFMCCSFFQMAQP